MDSWRRQQSQGDEATYESQKNTKPLSVPFWEQKFCWTVGNVPWEKLLETKKNMHHYKDVVQWNDSAVEEAFDDAKKRFLDKIDGLPCNIPLPDPDAYIHQIDWSNSRTSTGPELATDNQETRGKDEGEVVVDDLESLSDQSSWGTGSVPGAWDESEEDSEEDASGSVDNEENLDHKEAADIVGFDNNTWNKRDKNKMVQELMMGLMLESPLW